MLQAQLEYMWLRNKRTGSVEVYHNDAHFTMLLQPFGVVWALLWTHWLKFARTHNRRTVTARWATKFAVHDNAEIDQNKGKCPKECLHVEICKEMMKNLCMCSSMMKYTQTVKTSILSTTSWRHVLISGRRCQNFVLHHVHWSFSPYS